MCSFELKGVMYMIGGFDKLQRGPTDPGVDPTPHWKARRQYRINGDKVEEMAKLPFIFQDGSCINYDGENVLLVGGWGFEYDTWTFDGENYTKLSTETEYDHYGGGVARYTDNGVHGVVLVAGEFEYFGTTEFYRYFSNQRP